ncbi:hypothetical protein B0H11DRAFT_253374 [Mycena galericulata]|nr:hypothetical protein B0H11DRAFT_253374 [Mycena galericulata]
MTSSSEISVLCTVTGHANVFETVTFNSDADFCGQDLVAVVQRCHNDRCDCTTILQDVWKVEMHYSVDMGLDITRGKLERNPDASVIEPLDSLSEHFPTQPNLDLVNIVCEAVLPPSPSSSSPSFSTSSKRSWSSNDDQTNEPAPKRGKTRSSSPSPSSLSRSELNGPAQQRGKMPLSQGDSENTHLVLPSSHCRFREFRTRSELAFVDKTDSILHLSDRYRHLLLRPPRFGKTTLLTTLMHYYDIHESERFSRDFGSLLAATANTVAPPRHNQDLCVLFTLPAIYKPCDTAEVARYIKAVIDSDVELFLYKYAVELQVNAPDIPSWVQTHGDNLLKHVLDLVGSSGHTLFVGVDNYDAPISNFFFSGLYFPQCDDEPSASRTEIESLLDEYLWWPLRAATDVVAKLFITGTFFLRSPALDNLDKLALTELPSATLSCGFTEQQSLTFAQSIVDAPPSIEELRRLCGTYIFSPRDYDHLECELHPQRLIYHLSELSAPRFPVQDTVSFSLLSAMLRVLPQDSDANGVVSVDGLIDLLATGRVEVVGPMNAPINTDDTTVTWDMLYYLGALTFDRQSEMTLRVSSSDILSVIHSRINQTLARRVPALGGSIFTLFQKCARDKLHFELSNGDLTRLLRDQVKRAYGTRHEPDLRGILELVVDHPNTVESFLGGIDLFTPEGGLTRVKVQDRRDGGGEVRPLELRTLTLLGMWRGKHPNDMAPSLDHLQEFHQELMDDEAENLLDRPYASWSPAFDAMQTVLVRDFTDPERDVPLMLAVGGAHVLLRTVDEEI